MNPVSAVLALLAASVALAIAPAAHAAPPSNDHFANRIALTGPSDTESGSTVEATLEAGEPDHREAESTRTVWFSFTPAQSGYVRVDSCDSNFQSVVEVYTGGSLAALTPVNERWGACGAAEQTFYAQAGTPYQIALGGMSGDFGNYTIALQELASPPHDDLVDGWFISPGQVHPGTTSNASEEAGEPDHAGDPGGRSVWYRDYSFDGGERVVAETCGSAVDTVVAVYRIHEDDVFTGGYSYGVAEPVGAATDGCGAGDSGASVTFTMDAGYYYFTAVDGQGGAQGQFQLAYQVDRPDNDDFAGAEPLDLNSGSGYRTQGATREPGEPEHAGRPGGKSVWFTYTAATSSVVELYASDYDDDGFCTTFDTLLGVYTGGAVDALTEVASDDDAPGADGCGSSAEFLAIAGTTYRIAVDGVEGASGSGVLSAFRRPACTVVGTAGDDVLDGTPGADVICGGLGNDVVNGAGGNDVLFGGDGSDRLADGPGADEVEGGPGSDVIVAGTGSDNYAGGPGTDRLDYGSRLAAVSVDLGRGIATSGTEMDDPVDFERATGGSGADALVGDDRDNQLAGGPGVDRITGLDGEDAIDGGGGNDTVNAGEGDDVVEGSTGSDTLDGGPGVDALSYAGRGTASAPVAVKLDGLRNDGGDTNGDGTSAAAEEGDLDRGFEDAVGGAGNDRLTGGPGANRLAGGNGNDILDGGLGADTLDGGGGTDTMTYAARSQRVAVKLDGLRNDGADPDAGGASSATEEGDADLGVENATGGAGNDRLTGGPGANVLTGEAGADWLDGGTGRDTLEGSGGVDTVSYAGRGGDDRVAVTLDGARNDGADPDGNGSSSLAEENDLVSGMENATGGGGPDRLAGSAAANVLTGGQGNDRIEARDNTSVADQLQCGDGTADTFTADAVDVRVGCETALP